METISNSWHHTKIFSTNANNLDIQKTNDPLTIELAEMLNALYLSNTMKVKEFLTLPNKNIVCEISKNDQELANLFIIKNSGERVLGTKSSNDDSIEMLMITTSMALNNLNSVKMFLFQQKNASKQLKLLD